MQRKVMISCAVTGSADTPGRNPAVPVTPEQIAQAMGITDLKDFADPKYNQGPVAELLA